MTGSGLQPGDLARVSATVIEHAAEAVAIIDRDLRIRWVNKAFELITGYPESEVIGQPPGLLRSGIHAEDFYDGIMRALQEEGRWSGEIWRRRRNGEAFPAMLTITAVHDDAGAIEYFVDFFNDVSFIHGDRKQLESLVNHDALTGLPNRRLLWDRLETAVRRARRSEGRLAVLFIDLDHFKELNDSLGHPAGDRVLKAIAESFQSRLRSVDTLARVGGDEFVLILEDLDPGAEFDWVARLVEEAGDRCELPQSTPVRASIGHAIYPRDGHDAEALYEAADRAMYRAKTGRRDTPGKARGARG